MNVKVEELNGTYVAALQGEMDTAAALEVEETLKPLFATGGKDVIIDCKELEYSASCSASSRVPKQQAAASFCAM